tara:strand:+ start:49009 stop:49701 length:693 start_codon:yes stop_codon:yes gene_type:complete
MEIIKRRIIFSELEDNIYLKVPLYQNIDNMGLRTDMPFGTNIITELINDHFRQGGIIISTSDSKLSQLKSYDEDEQYKVDFNIKRENYVNYLGEPIIGVDRVTNISGETVTYVFDAVRDSFIGTTGQTTGILYQDNPIDDVDIPDELDSDVTQTRVQYKSEGWNQRNTSLDPQIQEEYLLGIISEPEVESDVFIDRSTFSVLDTHLRLSEVESLDHLTRYGNGFYNINRD